jgi:hypothetical protein
MTDIMAPLACFDQCVDQTTIRHLSRILLTLLMMTGRVTMRGISRWTDEGGSYRTHLQHVATAAAINVVRIVAWLTDQRPTSTRLSPFLTLMALA